MKEVDNVRVSVRCRPLNEKEVSQGCKVAVKVNSLLVLSLASRISAWFGKKDLFCTYIHTFVCVHTHTDTWYDIPITIATKQDHILSHIDTIIDTPKVENKR